MENRDQTIIRASVIGILANVFLAGFKAAIGIGSHSIAIVMDAVNNLSDAASSVITIIGTKLAGKEADKKHPFGYGRIEYLSAMCISLLVLYAGITAFAESVKKILRPEIPDYSPVALVIVGVAVLVKIALGFYVKNVGKAVHSDSLVNSGEDAAMDAGISASTLVAAAVYLMFHISLEAYLGAVIAMVIIKSGIEMLTGTLSRILGESVDAELAREIRSTIAAHPENNGAYDLILHDYGPESYTGSIHIEVPDTLSADDIDKLIRKVSMEVYEKHGVMLSAISVYSYNTKDPEAVAARGKVSSIAMADPNVLQMHGFYLDKEEKTLRFDLVVSLDAKDRAQVFREVLDSVQKEFPEYTIRAVMDTDFTEESRES